MKAAILLDDDLRITLSDPVIGYYLLRWALFWPEKDKNPSLALQFTYKGTEETLFSKVLDETGKKIALAILDNLLDKKYFYINMPGKQLKEHLNKRTVLSSMELIRKKIIEYHGHGGDIRK